VLIATKRKNHPKVSIIIVHLKNVPNLVDCLVSLNEINYPNFEIIIVHNGEISTEFKDQLDSVNKNIKKIINTESNLGFARANNIGIKEAIISEVDYILLLNDDTVVAPDFLNSLVDVAEKNSDIAILGPKIYCFDHPERIWFAGAKFKRETCQVLNQPADEIEVSATDQKALNSDYITGCSLLIKRSTLDQIGLLDERFFLYWEDVDWGLRVKKAQLNNAVVPNSRIWHKGSVSSGGPNSALKVYHKTRSHLLFHKLHIPGTKVRLIMKYGRDIAWLLFKASDQKRFHKARAYFSAIKDYYLGRTGKGPSWLWEDL
jgi:GT2 family glycosyltransferase